MLAVVSPVRAFIGDVSGDSRVDTLDARLIAGFLVGTSTSVPHPENADVNSDGLITTADALLIMQVSKGLRTSFASNALEVLAVMPSSGTTGVQLTANFSVFFSEPVLSGSLSGITLTDTATNMPVSGIFQPSQDGVIATFVPGQPLQPSRLYRINVTTAVKDNGGHELAHAFQSTFQTQSLGTLLLVSTNNVSSSINTVLPAPITVKALSASGAPVPQVPLVFAAQMGSGVFQPSGLRQVTVLTDSAGLAQASYRTGDQALLNTVSVAGVGFSTVPLFSVQTLPTPAVNLRLYTGDRQNGTPGASPVFPLIVQATDAGGDSIPGTAVTFRVVLGQGNFGGQPTATSVTGSSGTAEAIFTFGATTGTVLIQASFPDMIGQGPLFSLFNLSPVPSSGTTIVGRVIDSQSLLPLAHVYVYLADAPSTWDWTDQAGNFHLTTTPGAHVVEVDGFESGPINGNIYPVVAIPVNAVEGQVNDLGMPALLPRMDPLSYLDVSDTQGGTLTLRSNPLWSMYVAPGSAHFANGTNTGRLYVADVPADKIPMPVAGGKISRFFDTIQPLNVRFDPPAPVSFPNSDNLAPGTVTEIFTLSYTSGTFTRTGAGKVTEDGTVVRSLPGQGITAGGWHNSPDPVPSPLYCIRALLNLGSDVIAATLTAYGNSSAGNKIAESLWAFLLCSLPSNQGPASPVLTITTPPGDSPPVAGPGGGSGGGGGGGGSGPQPPYNAPPENPAPPEPPQLPTITGLSVELSTDVAYPGDTVKMTVTVLFDTPPARKDGIPIRIIDLPANNVTINGTQVTGVADFIGITDIAGQFIGYVQINPAIIQPLTQRLVIVVDKAMALGLAATILLSQTIADVLKDIRIKTEYEIDASALIDIRLGRPDAASIQAFLLPRIGKVFISPVAYQQFIFPANATLTDQERDARLALLATYLITQAPAPSQATADRFIVTGDGALIGDAYVLASASDHDRPLILSDKKVVNSYMTRYLTGLPRVKFVWFQTLSVVGGPIFLPPSLQ